MAAEKSYLFVSYSRQDLEKIRPLLDAIANELKFRALPVDLWVDISNLRPGEQWNIAIAEALQESIGFIFMVSPASLSSNWVRRELSTAAANSGRLIIPVLLHRPLDLPPELAVRQWLDFSGRQTPTQIAAAAKQIAEATQSYLRATPQPIAAVSKEKAPAIAAEVAQQARASSEPTLTESQPTSVFVVHGHNKESLAKLEKYLSRAGIDAVILSRRDESPQSLFQKFMAVAKQSRFAIVLLDADDYGASRKQYEMPKVGTQALQFRARQNVILELGFFYGRLGWENVFVLYQKPDLDFPNFERPSDLDGVIFDSISDLTWQQSLSAKLSGAGFKLPSSASLRSIAKNRARKTPRIR